MFETVLSPNAKTALDILGQGELLNNAYLAGGTSLALRLGHRISIDFDFFSPLKFDPIILANSLKTTGKFDIDTAAGTTLIGQFNNVKFSYFRYEYPLLNPTDDYQGIKIASIDDIIAMKLVAISDRNTKKDFIDLYTICHQKNISIEEMFELYNKKYHVLEENKYTLIKSMTYFEDADADAMPEMLADISWDEVKKFLISESLRLGKTYLS
ncbi:MAG: nucleotidyl transferase AbiEii/AbiGii toxin family protein [Candidatus Levybacteria bacterium]|nr:nucleotidyl transferase AbiEii/AbiGii toxin family protein [Candidatus Levybacteria bacterium]